jgi:hypothetical protein
MRIQECFGDDVRGFPGGCESGQRDPEVLLQSALRFFEFLPSEERQMFLLHMTEKA